MKKNRYSKIFAVILMFSSFILLNLFVSCKEKTTAPKLFESPYSLKNYNLQNYDFGLKNQNFGKSSNVSYVIFTNKTESPIVSLIFSEKNKKPVFKTVYIERNQSQVFEFKKNVPYKVELIDDKNHHYCKKISNGNGFDSFFSFEMDEIEIEYTDKDFAPQNLSDFILKFFGL